MLMSFRWYGENDSVPLTYIRQIPGVKGIVSALYDIPVGDPWSLERIVQLKETVRSHGLELSVIESVPVHEDIKLGKPSREKYIENYNETIRNLGEAGVLTVCYNFMPVFDWTRSSLEHQLPDGSTALAYEHQVIQDMNPGSGALRLPGWDTSYDDGQLKSLLEEYTNISEETLWGHLAYFLRAVIPVAESVGVKMAIHPDDPPWSIFGLPRIVRDKESLERLLQVVDSPSNGLCICSGSLGANPENDVPHIVRHFGKKGRVNFVHARNIKLTGERSFTETAHASTEGQVDMYEMMQALRDVCYEGPIRPDHGRMIWGEQGKPGYGLYDRALGAVYLNGLWEAITKTETKH